MKRKQSNVAKALLSDIDRCELCGSKRFLEVHHCIPVCVGGTDDEENLLVVCCSCHEKLTPRRLLQRIGINKAKQNNTYQGRKPIQIDANLFATEVTKWRNGEQTARDTMHILGLKPNTFYRRVRELAEAEL